MGFLYICPVAKGMSFQTKGKTNTFQQMEDTVYASQLNTDSWGQSSNDRTQMLCDTDHLGGSAVFTGSTAAFLVGWAPAHRRPSKFGSCLQRFASICRRAEVHPPLNMGNQADPPRTLSRAGQPGGQTSAFAHESRLLRGFPQLLSGNWRNLGWARPRATKLQTRNKRRGGNNGLPKKHGVA